jgi:hypothetical protein
MESGKIAPIRKVGGRTATQASTNWQTSTASVLKLVDPRRRAKR